MPNPVAPATQPDLVALLASHEAFSAQDRESLAAEWQVGPFAAGDALLAAGDLPTQLGLVLSGGVELQDADF